MKDRIKAIREDADLTQKEFADRIGVTMNYVYMMESGRREPSVATAREICRQFAIDAHWLQTGEGPMHSAVSGAAEAAAAVSRLLEEEPDSTAAVVISELLALNPHGPEWEAIGALLQRIAARTKKDPES